MSTPKPEPLFEPTAEPEATLDPVHCLFRTATACMLPFFLAGAQGDPRAACAAILELVKGYNVVTVAELDLITRMINFAAAAMDNLRSSMRPNLSDAKILKFRASAVTLDRSAERCRIAFEAIQARRRQTHAHAPQPRPVHAAEPPATAAPSPSALPQAQPHTQSRPTPPAPLPANTSPHPITTIGEDFGFESDIEAMRRNALAMIAAMKAQAQEAEAQEAEARDAEARDAEPPAASFAPTGSQRTRLGQRVNGATT